MKKYENIANLSIIQNKTNHGAFASRIIGEQYAKGSYIVHIDGDDFVKNTMCEELYPYCKSHKWDIIGFGWVNIGIDGKHTCKYHLCGEHSPQTISHLLGMPTLAFRNKIVKQSNDFIQEELFQEIPNLNNLEDLLKPLILSMFARNYYGINRVLYFCQNNTHSMTASCKNLSKNIKMIEDINTVTSTINVIMQYFCLDDDIKEVIQKNMKETIKPILTSYQYIYYHSKAYDNNYFAYPFNFVKSLHYTNSPQILCKTLARIFIYFITLGKIKI